MFGDLDWPLNASRRFVSISWASCLHWYRQPSQNSQEKEHKINTKTQHNQSGKAAVVNSAAQNTSERNLVITQRTDKAWFSRLSCHPATKRIGSILVILEPTCGTAPRLTIVVVCCIVS